GSIVASVPGEPVPTPSEEVHSLYSPGELLHVQQDIFVDVIGLQHWIGCASKSLAKKEDAAEGWIRSNTSTFDALAAPLCRVNGELTQLRWRGGRRVGHASSKSVYEAVDKFVGASESTDSIERVAGVVIQGEPGTGDSPAIELGSARIAVVRIKGGGVCKRKIGTVVGTGEVLPHCSCRAGYIEQAFSAKRTRINCKQVIVAGSYCKVACGKLRRRRNAWEY